MGIQNIAQAKAQIAETAAFKTLSAFFDGGEFTSISTLAKSGETYAEVVAGFGLVNEEEVYAFAQNPDFCGGAMSKAQAAKLKRLYELALKNGCPVVGFYDSKGARIDEGNAMLSGFGDILNCSSKLSGVVPQISVVLGSCMGTGALNAVSADFVIATKNSKLSLSTMGEDSDAEKNAEKGVVNILCEDEAEAIEKARELLSYLPQNNIAPAPFYEEAEPDGEGCVICRTVDAGSKFKLSMEYGDSVKTIFARIKGMVTGIVRMTGGEVSAKDAEKGAKFVRFCDAFSIPVITVVDSEGFDDIRSAVKLSSAYAEATTAKIALIAGKAYGALYIATAGTGAGNDFVYALPDAIISPVSPEAALLICDADKLNVPVSEQQAVAEQFARENLSAEKACENAYIDDVISEDELRNTLARSLEFLENKRVETLAKKHSTI